MTFRQNVRRVTRKTLGFSKEADVLDAHVALEIGNYNLVRHHSGLTVTEKISDGSTVKLLRTPAMAAGLTNAPWTHLHGESTQSHNRKRLKGCMTKRDTTKIFAMRALFC